MSINQISRIQHRTGKKDQLPESLAEAELGFTKDTGELFIGAPEFPPIQWRRSPSTDPNSTNPTGTSPFSNIKILTEFDTTYTLTGELYYHGPLYSNLISPSTFLSPNRIRLCRAEEFNNFVIEYSLVLDDQSGTPPFKKRIGTLLLIHDESLGSTFDGDTNISLNDQYSEINGDIDIQFGLEVVNDSGDLYLELLIANLEIDAYKLQWSGKRWLSFPTTV